MLLKGQNFHRCNIHLNIVCPGEPVRQWLNKKEIGKEIIRKLVAQGKEWSVTATASKLIKDSQGDEWMCVNTHQATGEIPAKTTAGDTAKGNNIIVRKSGVQTLCNGGNKNRDQMSVYTMSSSFTFPGIGLVRSYGGAMERLDCYHDSASDYGFVMETCTCPYFLYRRPWCIHQTDHTAKNSLQ